MAEDWDTGSPSDDDIVSQFPANERASREAVRSIFGVDHHVDEDSDQGKHEVVTLIDIEEDPVFPEGQVGLWNNDGELRTRVGSGSAGPTGFPSGTRMAFNQTSAPLGWTKDTSLSNNSAFRFVTGSVGTGGSVAFTSAFQSSRSVSGSVAGHTLTISQIPSHSHTYSFRTLLFGVSGGGSGSCWAGTSGTSTSSVGGGGSHSHGWSGSVNLDVRYIDLIIAEKD